MNSLQNFDYNGQLIQRRDDGFVNLTQMAQANGKNISDFLRLKSTKAYLEEMESDMGIPASQILIVQKGNSIDYTQGTWGHPELAIFLAQWISPKFHRWCNAHIFNLMASGQTSLDIDPLEEMRLKIELAKIESQKEAAIASGKNAELQLTQFRHYVTIALPEPVQQKILGYQVVKQTEVIERVIDKSTGETSDGVGITYIAKRLGFKNNGQCWAWLERQGYGKDSEHWKPELAAITSHKLSRDDFDYLCDLVKESGDRQMFLGE